MARTPRITADALERLGATTLAGVLVEHVRLTRFSAKKLGIVLAGTEGGHLCHLLRSYLDYYNETRTHLSLDKDAPVWRAIQAVGRIIGRPVLDGLHHQQVRI